MGAITFIHPAESHLGDLASILNHYIEHTTVTFHMAPLDASDMKEKVFFSTERFQAFIIMEEDQVVGYCAVSPWKKQEAYIHTGEVNIYLHPTATGRGIGKFAIRFLIQFAQKQEIHNLIAGICAENTASLKLFEHAGFERCAHFRQVGKKFGRLLDTIYLQKMI